MMDTAGTPIASDVVRALNGVPKTPIPAMIAANTRPFLAFSRRSSHRRHSGNVYAGRVRRPAGRATSA